MAFFPFLFRLRGALSNRLWVNEHRDIYTLLDTAGGEAFAETLDKYKISWFVKFFEKVSPLQKQIFIDEKDRDIFHDLYK